MSTQLSADSKVVPLDQLSKGEKALSEDCENEALQAFGAQVSTVVEAIRSLLDHNLVATLE